MKFITEIANVLAATDNQSEVNMLRELARSKIDSRAITASIFSNWINELQVVHQGTYGVIIKDDFGGYMVKEQRLNDALWLISLSLLTAFHSVNATNIGGAMSKWSTDKENCLTVIDEEEGLKLGSIMVIALQQQGWLALVPTRHVETINGEPVEVNKFDATELFSSVRENCLNELAERQEMSCQPLRFKPQPWTDNFTGIGENANITLVKGRKKSHVSPHALKAANDVMEVAYNVNPIMLEIATLVRDNPSDFRDRLGYGGDENLKRWKEVYKQFGDIAELQADTDYWFPTTYDSRGRMYYRGGRISPQGHDCCKAAFMYSSRMPLGSQGIRAMCLVLANALGIKGSINGRIKVVAENMEKMTPYIGDFFAFCARFPKADKCQAYVIMHELHRALEYKREGRLDEFYTGLVCHQDGTCNGLQHIAAMTKDARTARLVNVCASNQDEAPIDCYTLVANGANANRDCGKHVVMLGGYGASESTMGKRVMEELGEAYTEQLMEALLASLGKEAPALGKFTVALKNRCEHALKSGVTRYSWMTFDGFECEQQYIDDSANVFHGKHYSAHLGKRHEARLDLRKMVTATPPNLNHSNDGCHLRVAVVTARMQVTPVHDSFGTHPCNFFGFNTVLRKTFRTMHEEHSVLDSFTDRQELTPIKFITADKLDFADIEQACNMFS